MALAGLPFTDYAFNSLWIGGGVASLSAGELGRRSFSVRGDGCLAHARGMYVRTAGGDVQSVASCMCVCYVDGNERYLLEVNNRTEPGDYHSLF